MSNLSDDKNESKKSNIRRNFVQSNFEMKLEFVKVL